ncbi:UDP-2,3-diacylglucosamine diphosphatase [Sulfurospirillum arcachonense]|uniref:UDP-2,3-diacylglucosamine diphosphatase n=1 Tax=Sulfurospirillum arcachonense TaxID=57666 RepID=UPI00046A8E11|nr:metallophosphoesterase [Sulfurospirillum arcachonense]
MCLKINNGAIFIADAHEDENNEDFYNFLKQIDSKKIQASQLFLMGDMFDLLVGKVNYGVSKYKKYIELIEKISCSIEVIYYEGNHDFSLSTLFKNVKVIPIENQPTKALLEDGTVVYLSHGDKYGDLIHKIYTKLIRSNGVLKVLNMIDMMTNNTISKNIENAQLKKHLCKKIENFEDIISAKLFHYKALKNSYILEGHYHQNYKFKRNDINYINLPSFACKQSYFIVECSYDEKFALRGCNV